MWLTSRVTVLPGASIGAGSVITAGSVVSGSIPPGVVAGGIPARVIRQATAAEVSGQVEPQALPAPPALKRPEVAHRGLLISDFTIDELALRLEADLEEPGLTAEVAPFGQVVQALLQGSQGEQDFAVVWTRPETAIASFGRLLGFEAVPLSELLAEVDTFCELLVNGLQGYKFAFVPTWTLPGHQRGLGVLDARDGGATRALAAINLRLMERLAVAPNLHVLNAQRWIDAAGQKAHSPKLWYLGKVPFDGEVFAEAARDLKAAVRGLTGKARKLLVLDLDDTLWGGIVGDAGWQNLRLGGHDSVGEALVDFQRAVKALTRRGIVLGIVSKNEEATALEAINSHPEMVLKLTDFVGWKINWTDKAKNIVDLAFDLNLGLQSVVFIDDNPLERARVRESLPEVLVPEWPEDKLLYPSALVALRCFDAPALSREDAERTQLYASEKRREELKRDVGSIEQWLSGLEIRVRAEPLGPTNLARTTQLLNKTNQMNLSTRRLTEVELTEWAKGPGRGLWAVSVSDKFGDAGLTGIVSLEANGAGARIVDFVLSCRVMGRKVEETMVHLAVARARELGLGTVEAVLLPTSKNKPCLDFWKGSGFARDGERFHWNSGERAFPLPGVLSLEWIK